MFSASEMNMLDFDSTMVNMFYDGYIIAPTVQRLTTHCPVSLQKFPLDTQTCTIELAMNMPEGCIKFEETTHPDYTARYWDLIYKCLKF